METAIGATGGFDLSFFLDDIQVNDAADAGGEETERRDGETEALATDKAKFCFIDVAIVERLTGALTVAEGEEHTCRGEETCDNERCDQCDTETEDALDQIGGNGGYTGVEDLRGALFGELLIGCFKGRRDEAERQGVVGDDLQRLHAVSCEDRLIEHHVARDGFIDRADDEQQHAAEDGCGNERIFQKGNAFFDGVGGDQAAEQDCEKADPAPNIIIPKIFHMYLLR